MPRLFHLIFIVCLQVVMPLQANAANTSPSTFVSSKVWKKVEEFMMPNNHPAKPILDQIFSQSRAFLNMEAMQLAGFAPAIPQHHTHIIVTRHPALPGYVIKAYLDEQPYHSGEPEHFFWIKRVTGAKLIQEFINEHHYGHLFKVPQKWIYLIPDEPAPPSDYLRKMFILVETDMDIFDDATNQTLWGSNIVTEELLNALYVTTTELGLFDCAKPANCSFSKDGRAAFVDTQSFHKKKVKYYKLTPFLSPEMQKYWGNLIKTKGKV